MDWIYELSLYPCGFQEIVDELATMEGCTVRGSMKRLPDGEVIHLFGRLSLVEVHSCAGIEGQPPRRQLRYQVGKETQFTLTEADFDWGGAKSGFVRIEFSDSLLTVSRVKRARRKGSGEESRSGN